MKIGVTKEAPVIDGDLQDVAWLHASVCEDFLHYSGEKLASQQTKVYVTYDDKNLYVFFLCFDSAVNELKTAESFFAGDVVEIFLDPGRTYEYTHIAVNAAGKTYFAWQQGNRMNDVTAAIKVMKDRWQAEIAIPWNDVKWAKSGTISNWGINFCRTISRGKEYSCWSPTLVGFHNPSRFGIVSGSMKVDAGQFYVAQQRTGNTDLTTLTVNTDRTFYASEKDLEAFIRLRFNGSLAEKKMRLSVKDSSGKIVREDTVAPVLLTNRKSINIADLSPGDYSITVSLAGDDNKISESTARFRKTPPMPEPANKVDIRKGVIYLNDKPHLPIILYFGSAVWSKANEMSAKDIDDARSKGFNTLLPTWEFLKEDLVGERERIWKPVKDGSINRMKTSSMTLMEILDAAHKRNLQVIPYFGYMWRTERLNDIERIMMGADIIQKYRHHPAILCWHANDETDGWTDLNRKVYGLFRELDPYRPVHLNLIYAVASNKAAADILSTDPYPIGKTNLMQVAVHADTLKHVIGRNADQSAWLVLQMFGSPSEGWPRCPTPQELKCMTFLALNHGSKGLAYFGYAPESVRQELGEKRLSEELWQSMTILNQETTAMSMPYLLGTDVEGIVTDAAELDIAVKRYQGKTYIIACNTSDNEVRAKISAKAVKLPKRLQVLFENRSVRTVGPVIEDKFAAHAVHIYKM